MRSLLVDLAFHRLLLHSSTFFVFIGTRKNVVEKNEKLESMLYFFRPVLPKSDSRRRALESGDIQRPRCICLPLHPELPCRAGIFHWEPSLLLCPKGSSPPGELAFWELPQSLHLLIIHVLFLKGSQDSHNNHVEISSPVQKAGTTSAYPPWV